jgi:hypothetical protein
MTHRAKLGLIDWLKLKAQSLVPWLDLVRQPVEEQNDNKAYPLLECALLLPPPPKPLLQSFARNEHAVTVEAEALAINEENLGCMPPKGQKSPRAVNVC